MSAIALGGGSSAVAASSHAACARFRHTDPLITGQTRRQLADDLGHPDTSGTIPEARWVRAMTFEALINRDEFATRIATTTVGSLGLSRPSAITIVNARRDVARTAELLEAARDRAVAHHVATLVHSPAVPYPDFDVASATSVLPDFVVVTAKNEAADDAWLVVGDAKDFERVRSRIDDQRMLKGYIQVAFGAEAFHQWPDLPAGLTIHRFGVLAVPRNSFLQPLAVTEDLTDHRTEVRARLLERRAEAGTTKWTGDPRSFVTHLSATFDPVTCVSCSLFGFCRDELRASLDPGDLLVEIGVAKEERESVAGLVGPAGVPSEDASPSTVAHVQATVSGRPVVTGQRRLDPIGQVGTVNVVVVKSDSAALGVHGLAVQVVGANGPETWKRFAFETPQTDATRRAIVGAIGAAVAEAMGAVDTGEPGVAAPVHLVVPDRATADVLASIADTLAGVEISRLRWERDVEVGREPVTFDGQPATIPVALTADERLGVSFLLEEDRARAFAVRSPVVDARSALVRLKVPGGPVASAGRLDYVVGWARATDGPSLDHRAFADAIEQSLDTPGAKLSNALSDELFTALTGGKLGHAAADRSRYADLVGSALDYRVRTLEAAIEALAAFDRSTLAGAVRAIEGDAQAVWRRRWALQAYDLIRFGLTTRYWRNTLVSVVEADAKADAQITALTHPQWATEQARQAGVRELAVATVASESPLLLDVASRRIGEGTTVVVLHRNGIAQVEEANVETLLQKGSVRIGGLGVGPLASADDTNPTRFEWSPTTPVTVEVGDELVIADAKWFGTAYGRFVKVDRPGVDAQMSPRLDCEPGSYASDPERHRWCCQPHAAREAAISDMLAEKRVSGELNPQTWPPVLDADAFDVTGTTDATAESVEVDGRPQPDGATVDDLE